MGGGTERPSVREGAGGGVTAGASSGKSSAVFLTGGAAAVFGIELKDRRAFRHLVPDLDEQLAYAPSQRRRHVHGRLVAFERDERQFELDGFARLHVDFDYGDALEITNVWNPNVYQRHGGQVPCRIGGELMP